MSTWRRGSGRCVPKIPLETLVLGGLGYFAECWLLIREESKQQLDIWRPRLRSRLHKLALPGFRMTGHFSTKSQMVVLLFQTDSEPCLRLLWSSMGLNRRDERICGEPFRLPSEPDTLKLRKAPPVFSGNRYTEAVLACCGLASIVSQSPSKRLSPV